MSAGVFQTLNTQYQEASERLEVLQKFVYIQNMLDLVITANKTKDFTKAAEALLEIQLSLSKPITNDDKEIKILSALHEESIVQKEKFLFDLGNQWNQIIVWDVKKKNEKTDEVICKFKIEKDAENLESLQKVVLAMEKFEFLESKIEQFGKRLVTCIFKPLITDSQCQISENDSSCMIEVRYVSRNVNGSFQNPREIFSKYGSILHLLHEYLSKLFVVKNEEVDCSPDLMKLLGSSIANQVLELVKECLKAAIPTNNTELESFKEIISMTEVFHNKLVEFHFIPSSNNILVDFIQNINVLFANKKCQEILERARKLMTTEMHNTVRVSSDRPLGELPPLGSDGGGKNKRKLDLVNEIRLSSNTFKLPDCHIR